MERLIQLTKTFSGDREAFSDVYLTIDKISATFIPKLVQRNLRWDLATFLLLYPMPAKKVKIYNTLKDKHKLSFLIRYLIGQAYAAKLPKQLMEIHKSVKERVESAKWWIDHETKNYKKLKENESKSKATDYNSYDVLKNAIKVDIAKAKVSPITAILTDITKDIITALFDKRLFLLNKNPYAFIERLTKEKSNEE